MKILWALSLRFCAALLLATAGCVAAPREEPSADLSRYVWPSYAPTSIELGPDTRALDFDGKPGDDGVCVRISPKDNARHTVKWPGLIEITLAKSLLADMGNSKPLCKWVITPKEAENEWIDSALSGYLFKRLPWPQGKRPEVTRGILNVSFITRSGNVLKASKSIEISLP